MRSIKKENFPGLYFNQNEVIEENLEFETLLEMDERAKDGESQNIEDFKTKHKILKSYLNRVQNLRMDISENKNTYSEEASFEEKIHPQENEGVISEEEEKKESDNDEDSE